MFIIDGHNLIPKIRGLSLGDINDEQDLAILLQQYARLKRKKVIVFFDGAPPGQAGERRFGVVQAFFVPLGRTADDAIYAYLKGLGKAAGSATVVSSDHMVRSNAKSLRAGVLTSEEFARQLSQLPAGQDTPPGKQPARGDPSSTPPADVTHWIDVFGFDPERVDEPINLSKRPPRPPKAHRQKPDQQPPDAGDKKKPRPHHGFPRKS